MRFALTVSRAMILRADRRLDRDVEHLPRDQLAQPLGHLLPVRVGLRPVHDRAEGVDRLAVQEHVDADDVGLLIAPGLVVERCVAARARLQLIEEVEDDLGERQHVVHLGTLRREEGRVHQLAPARLAEVEHRPEVLLRRDDRGEHDRLLDAVVGAGKRHLRRVVHDGRLVSLDHVELDVGLRRDELQVELPLEPLLHDVHVQQAEEPGPEPEAQGLRDLGLVAERRVGELQAIERLTELGVVAALVREQPRPHHRLRLAVAGERLLRGVLAGHRDRVADLREMDVLQPGDEVAHLAGTEPIDRGGARGPSRRPPPPRTRRRSPSGGSGRGSATRRPSRGRR